MSGFWALPPLHPPHSSQQKHPAKGHPETPEGLAVTLSTVTNVFWPPGTAVRLREAGSS